MKIMIKIEKVVKSLQNLRKSKKVMDIRNGCCYNSSHNKEVMQIADYV